MKHLSALLTAVISLTGTTGAINPDHTSESSSHPQAPQVSTSQPDETTKSTAATSTWPPTTALPPSNERALATTSTLVTPETENIPPNGTATTTTRTAVVPPPTTAAISFQGDALEAMLSYLIDFLAVDRSELWVTSDTWVDGAPGAPCGGPAGGGLQDLRTSVGREVIIEYGSTAYRFVTTGSAVYLCKG